MKNTQDDNAEEVHSSATGRPSENRVRLTIHVLPSTAARINFLVNKANRAENTQGKIVDWQFCSDKRAVQ